MKLASLFSGGKDSCLAIFLAKKAGHEISCLITIESENKESYMFHVPSISRVDAQAKAMGIPLILQKTKGKKEEELRDLEKAIKLAKDTYNINGIVTGAVASVYQAARIQKICDKLGLECINPLWKMDQIELLNELIKNDFEVIITGVFAYPLTKEWLGRKIDEKYVEDVTTLWEKYKVNPAGEGGEFESFVLYCPLFKKRLKVKDKKISGEKHAWSMEIELD
ncbi:MAG: diphthine--ammonia ligase [archaeon]